ncbi:PTS lactose/cellobiose transporter subunit IIA [Salipaludibacillus sp. LMS25]|jgi:PTS system cellobiose-specific IIA component|uniref:PTS lactose/cellobiose transporter subunit IIA n=1 Tax=Salipaludibacillus sp. LMS25 TaxID=2924031 RepID=UPI0020D04614|nr:PTS lactose/cellobiose transporter subunit IIA [Salipaludibacillus sp. LMS25]UTR13174.1 PTS lactose/cellobiose transporter subunit IIA [Salipaludibacillus sp. LMS25]
MDYQETIMGIIVNGGNARSKSMEAISEAKEGNYEQALKKIEEAAQDLAKAHRVQTDLIQGEARGENTEITLLMVHAQDHLMNAMTVKDMASEFIALYEKNDASCKK